jgi:putative glycosyltransferase (TIGR04372 family)
VREGGYSLADEKIQSYRNADIENYLPAIKHITSKGGWVIRIGGPESKKIPTMNNVIDYAHSELKTDRLDIILCARAKFVLGSTSGICLVSTIFGVPVAIANCAPSGGLGFGCEDLSIPKKIYDAKANTLMSYIQSLEAPCSVYRHASQYIFDNLTLIENTEDEILLLVKEMMERLSSPLFLRPLDTYNKLLYRDRVNKNIYSYNSVANVANFYLENN